MGRVGGDGLFHGGAVDGKGLIRYHLLSVIRLATREWEIAGLVLSPLPSTSAPCRLHTWRILRICHLGASELMPYFSGNDAGRGVKILQQNPTASAGGRLIRGKAYANQTQSLADCSHSALKPQLSALNATGPRHGVHFSGTPHGRRQSRQRIPIALQPHALEIGKPPHYYLRSTCHTRRFLCCLKAAGHGRSVVAV